MAQLPHSLDYIRQVVADYFADKPVRRVEVFGSYARGEATAESDLDLHIDWRRIRSFRNLIAHEYFRVDYARILHTAQQIVPQLLPLLEGLLVDLDQQFGPDASV